MKEEDGWICFGVLEEVGIYPKGKITKKRREEVDWNLDGGGPICCVVHRWKGGW